MRSGLVRTVLCTNNNLLVILCRRYGQTEKVCFCTCMYLASSVFICFLVVISNGYDLESSCELVTFAIKQTSRNTFCRTGLTLKKTTKENNNIDDY